MPNAIFYNFTKRKNSTAIPSSSGTSINFSYKEGSDIHNPLIEVTVGTEFSYTYAYMNSRYYYVASCETFTETIFRVKLTLDTLATYRGNIFATTAYVEFSSSHFNQNISDTRMNCTNQVIINESSINLPIFNATIGTYLLTTIADAGGQPSNGFTTTYATSAGILGNVASYLVNANDIWEELEKWLKSPYDSVISCNWLPLDISVVQGQGTSGTIYLGNYSTGQGASVVTNPSLQGSTSIDIPWNFDDFRNAPPYTTASLYLPVIGLIDISTSDLYGANRLQIDYSVDILSGDMAYKISRLPGGRQLNTIGTNIMTNLTTGQTTTDVGSVVKSIGVAIGGVVSSVATGGLAGLGIAFGALANTAVAANARGSSSSGSYTGRASARIDQAIRLVLYSKDTSQSPQSMGTPVGRPFCTTVQIGTLSGYCECRNASVAISGYDKEREEINAYLNGGFYIE